MWKPGVIIIFTILTTEYVVAMDFPRTVAQPQAKQSYGQVLARVDTSSLPAHVKSSIALFTNELKKQPGAACVQFHGRSGTGKTLAAVLLAKGFGREAYRVDLAAVISKYIGETEKNLERVFSMAAERHWVLLFDEADALFGKRSKVKDAHDRYANIDTNYLLAKLEQYQGIWILASNRNMQLDPALEQRCSTIIKVD